MKTWFAIDGTLEPIEYEGPSFFRFPEELAERVLLRYSSVGEWVFDPFCGFGTTLVLAQLFHFEGEIVRCNTGPEPASPGFDHSYLLVFTCGGRE